MSNPTTHKVTVAGPQMYPERMRFTEQAQIFYICAGPEYVAYAFTRERAEQIAALLNGATRDPALHCFTVAVSGIDTTADEEPELSHPEYVIHAADETDAVEIVERMLVGQGWELRSVRATENKPFGAALAGGTIE